MLEGLYYLGNCNRTEMAHVSRYASVARYVSEANENKLDSLSNVNNLQYSERVYLLKHVIVV